jgi:hypothetical protein
MKDEVKGIAYDPENGYLGGSATKISISTGDHKLTFGDEGKGVLAKEGRIELGKNIKYSLFDSKTQKYNELFSTNDKGDFFVKARKVLYDKKINIPIGFWNEEGETVFRRELNIDGRERKTLSPDEALKLRGKVQQKIFEHINEKSPEKAKKLKESLNTINNEALKIAKETGDTELSGSVSTILNTIDKPNEATWEEMKPALKTLNEYFLQGKLEEFSVDDSTVELMTNNFEIVSQTLNSPEVIEVGLNTIFEEGDSYNYRPTDFSEVIKDFGFDVPSLLSQYIPPEDIEANSDNFLETNLFVDSFDGNVYFHSSSPEDFKFNIRDAEIDETFLINSEVRAVLSLKESEYFKGEKTISMKYGTDNIEVETILRNVDIENVVYSPLDKTTLIMLSLDTICLGDDKACEKYFPKNE